MHALLIHVVTGSVQDTGHKHEASKHKDTDTKCVKYLMMSGWTNIQSGH